MGQATKPWASVVPSLREKCMDGAAVIILQGKNIGTTYKDGVAVRADEPTDTYMPFIVRGRDDVFHAETVRKAKGYGIVAIEHLDNLAKKKPAEAQAIATMIARITRSPETDRKLEEANGKIAELEAKLAEVQGSVSAKAEAELKLEAGARAVAENRVAELETKLAQVNSGASEKAKVEADLKAEADARAAAEARIAELEAKLAQAGSAPDAPSAPDGSKKSEKK